ncbi:protein sda1 homolog isoform x1 [Plasmopara halstedii]|uniref:Protein SDA1 n=1 Tax=Plasmopara halstedii TaxID=4781 RepID=A0A0P1AYI5_PLAHL|nr:protein sda1 homolog isoform x1 [Plasmopara halstedii]CEG45802.1 protein sda1 homolog isoform x1 [Plasmopara halstedii]|eukprot:XP_024582171.1 protein sda1 homolog isoform x1 [Plasmopara halstedii]
MEAVNASRPDVIGKLPQLQNMVKRDPLGYRTEFLMQLRHFESEYQLFLLQPTKESAHFGALVLFLSHVAKCFPEEMVDFPKKIIGMLHDNYLVLEPELRKTLVHSLMLLRNRGLVDAITLLKLFFELFRCPDKRLRELLYKHIVSDIRQLNATSRNVKVNKALQNFMFEMLNDESEQAAVKSLQVLMELFKRKVWHDQRSVNVIATACTSKNTKLLVMALSFFLGIDEDILKDEEQQKKQKKALVVVDYHSHSKKTKKRQRDTLAALCKNKRARKRELDFKATFPAIELLNNPQGVAERQLKLLKSCTESFDVKLLMMNFIGRLLGFHKLVLLSFYPLLQRYLQSHQQSVTAILAYLIQSCHDEIPPEELLSIVKSIAHNFVTERCSSEVIAVGINALRELFRRVPLLLECEGIDVLVSDLIQYNRARDKTIVMAARGVLNLIRDIHPALLKRKDRGKFHNKDVKPHRFGELVACEGVDGADLLAEAEAAGRFDGEENKDGWEVASSTSGEDESSDEWVDVSSDEEDIKGGDNTDINDDDAGEGEVSPLLEQKDRLDARRILTPLDFERIEMLKKERDAALKDPKSRSKRKAEEDAAKASSDATKVNPVDLEGYTKKKRMTQEERLRLVLEGREDFKHKRSGGGTTNTEKKRLKHFMMIKKSKAVQSKVLVSARQVQRQKNRVVKKILKHDAKKRRKI